MKTLATTMLRHSCTLTIPDAVTGWHEFLHGNSVKLAHVHLQRGAGELMYTRGGMYDVDTPIKAKLWYDAKLSTPRGIDFVALMQAAEAAGGFLLVEWQGTQYRVQGVDELMGGEGAVHHYRLELI